MTRREVILQALYNGWIDLEPPAPGRIENHGSRIPLTFPDALEQQLREAPAWLKLLSPTHSWPPEQLFRWSFESGVTCLAVRPCNPKERSSVWVAVGLENGQIHFYDLQSGTPVYGVRQKPTVLSCGRREVFSMAWSPDGLRLASMSRGRLGRHSLRLWNVEREEEIWVRQGVEDGQISWSPDGRLLACADDATVRIWDAELGTALDKLESHNDQVTAITWSPDGKRLVSAARDGEVHIWDSTQWRLLHLLLGHEGEVHSILWIPDNGCILTAGSDGSLRYWDADVGVQQRSIPIREVGLRVVAWSLDGLRLASAGAETIQVWDRATGALLNELHGHESTIKAVEWSPDGSLLISGGDGARVWYASHDGGIVASLEQEPSGTCSGLQTGGASQAHSMVVGYASGMRIPSCHGPIRFDTKIRSSSGRGHQIVTVWRVWAWTALSYVSGMRPKNSRSRSSTGMGTTYLKLNGHPAAPD